MCSALEDIRVGSKTGRRLLPTTAVGVLQDQRFHKLGFALLSPIYVGPRSRSRSDEAGWLLTRRRFTRDHPWLQVSRRVAGPEP